MAFELWLAFVAAATVILIIPGPTVILVASYAMAHGRKVAVATAAGVALGDLVAMTASLLGLGALVMASAALFSVLKWIGAAYLMFLGVKLWRSAATATLDDLPIRKDVTARGLFTHSFAVTALNPKSIAFFIAFVPQFLVLDAPMAPQFVVLIATFVTLAAVNAFAYAFLADGLRSRLARPAVLRGLTRAGGGTLIAMGVLTAATRRAA